MSETKYTDEHSNNFHKEYIRRKAFEIVERTAIKCKVLTLTKYNYSFELDLVHAGNHVIIVEQDEEIHEKHKDDLAPIEKKGVLTLIHSDVSKYVNKTQNYFNLAWLDFCGPFCAEVHHTLIDIRADIIFLTLLRRRDRYAKYLSKDNSRYELHAMIFKTCGYYIKEYLEYNNEGSPMVLYVLQPLIKRYGQGTARTRITLTSRLNLIQADEFTTDDVREVWSDLSDHSVTSLLSKLKNAELIKTIRYGSHVKLKDND